MAAKTKPKKGNPFTPFVTPTRPPAGFFDPTLDAQQAAATRGLTDLEADTRTAQQRAQDDLYRNQQQLGTQKTWGLEDIATQRSDYERDYGRSLADLVTSRNRGTEDYRYATAERGRQYGVLANNQLQGANAAGLTGGGALAQAAAKRRANQGREQAQSDLSYNRFLTDSQTAEQRLGENRSGAVGQFDRAQSRLGVQSDNALADLALGYERGNTDSSNSLVRAQRENTFFGADTDAQRWFQASQAGFVAPSKPKGENTKNGVTYHRLADGRAKLPDGTIVSREKLRQLIARGAA